MRQTGNHAPFVFTGDEKRRVVFISGPVNSIGHIYRVEHPLRALLAHGWQATWVSMDDPLVHQQIDHANLVVVFRVRWNEAFASMIARSRVRGIPVAYDIDDLLFDEAIIASGQIGFLHGQPDHVIRNWIEDAGRYRKALESADAAVLTTMPLADAAARYNPSVHVLCNALDERMEAMAHEARSEIKKPATDGCIRLLFASGTPSHQRDFAVVAGAVANLMARHARVVLRVVGHLDPYAFPILSPLRNRIECRPRVAFADLFSEVAACDINLCPLELGNSFCEAKSAVRCLVAAAAGVPSVATPTHPLREAIADGCTGFLAGSTAEWEASLEKMVTRTELRQSMGRAARDDALARYGYKFWHRQAVETYKRIIQDHKSRRFDK